MPEGMTFDELNRLYDREHEGHMRSMPYDEYFGEMDLSEEQIDRRKQTARDIEEFTLFALLSLYYQIQIGAYDYSYVSSGMSSSYNALLERLGTEFTAAFRQQHVDLVVSEIINTTLQNMDDPYVYSEDRARFIAENEANSVWNDAEYEDALLTGKTRKRWSAILDKRTRDTHRDVNGADIPISELFVVGDSLMAYPRDDAHGAGAEEIVNCRCSVIYY